MKRRGRGRGERGRGGREEGKRKKYEFTTKDIRSTLEIQLTIQVLPHAKLASILRDTAAGMCRTNKDIKQTPTTNNIKNKKRKETNLLIGNRRVLKAACL